MIIILTLIVWGYALYVGLKFNTIEQDMIVLRPYAIKAQIVSVVMIFVYCMIVFFHIANPETSHDMVLVASLLVMARQVFENYKALKNLTQKRKSDVACQSNG